MKKRTYVGVTKWKVMERIKEHKSDIKFNRNRTALSKRMIEKNIEIDFENIKKLCQQKLKSGQKFNGVIYR